MSLLPRVRTVAIAPMALALLGLVAVLLPLGFAAPAHAAAPSYVALGDSYASGLGTRSYTNSNCRRSDLAYPRLVADQRGYSLDFRACSGATVPNVRNNQLGGLGAGTDFVSVQVGGNDAGFADVITECATPWWAGNCNAAIDGAQAFIRNQLPGRLSNLYGDIRSRAASAEVVVVGYPRLFMGEDCNAGTWFSPAEQDRLNATADLLNDRIRAQAAAAGFGFVDPTGRFVGHAVCDNTEWVNGLAYPIDESYHPNRAGHRDGYRPLVAAQL
ncbi:SGNH/GDSL hydrolase family protein [Nocardioides panacisoli]|uniref:SGNH/GDSL hydrolase family protein n=1 Tax=Nocardioides panacisoli TaxID=627624 RepID=UPI001C639A61|nr:SGNH/GDSL hydrolase family protein [Nocardioides panacisoli]QYJ03426.1 SGNH/GDSL hydrolase family protein [Nocardioides panacisoli]